MQINRSTLVALLVACLAGYWLASSPAVEPKPSRPVARWIARAAKNCLWFLLVAEPAPPAERSHLLHSPQVGEDGYQIVNHGQGW